MAVERGNNGAFTCDGLVDRDDEAVALHQR